MTDVSRQVPAPRLASRGRRAWLGLAAAGALGAAGGGALWWSRRERPGVPSELWSLALPTPQGGTLRLADWRGRPLVINFWATWCAPCLEEMPMLDQFQAEAGGLPVLGLAADRLDAVQRFLQRLPVRFPIGVLPAGGLDLTRRLGNEKGGLPYSLLMGRHGEVLQRKGGQLHAEDLRAWARSV